MNKDLNKIIKEIIDQRNFVLFFSSVLSIIALVYLLFFYQPDYTSTSKIYLSDKQSNQLSLGGLSQFGIQMPLAGGSATSQISVLGEVVESHSFLEALLNENIKINDSTTRTLYKWINPDLSSDINDYKNVVNSILILREMISVVENYESSVVKIEVTAKNNYVTQSINELLIKSANNFLIKKENERAYNKLLFINERMDEVEKDLNNAENTLKDFRYKNIKVGSSPDLQMQLEKLLRDVQFQTNIMSTLLEQREVAKIQNIEKSEIFNILSEPNLPIYPSSSRRLYQLIFYVALSISLPILLIIAKVFYLNLLIVSRNYYSQSNNY
tara:strand:- start:12025 stop:13005 length:981 start_codon:yes stop_codon:yes gene_type:complete